MVLDADFRAQLAAIIPQLLNYLEAFTQARVLVVGDLMLDEFLTGEVERVSREAPVLILRHETTRQLPGGGANAIYNLAALGAEVVAVGLVGKDDQGCALQQILSHAGVDTQGILLDRERPTVTKTRIVGHARQSVTQQIVRVDRKSNQLPNSAVQAQLIAHIQQRISTVDAVICSDYGDGVLTAPVIQAALAHKLTIVDTQTQLAAYQGATLFTPNLPEAEAAIGYKIDTPQVLLQAGQDLLALTQAQQMLITQGEAGMSLFDAEGMQTIPAFNRTEVFDVTGAGDTVVAALTLALTAGATPWQAAILGNLAASIVVRQFGTATTTVAAMRQALQALVEEN